ncbi:glycosyltransferase [Paenibacillus sp. JX-17]|uniref:Glycosyltransferase n=1 Tax=Paenibacillus lacisoli TaxID=3064525 RepID=A0ABT9CCM7_9BACL|nr:glycosyltransferase [Paenibacillus sp. JX-17]MDO7906982.1 glycosyltransferase [Paenibacillus sp. JX-17]
MNVLFVFYNPSGGMDTVNRERVDALRAYGINGHCLYFMSGPGVQNNYPMPTFVTNNDNDIYQILMQGSYTAIIVVSAYDTLPRLRGLGYTGRLIFEVQGFGPKEVARQVLSQAQPVIETYADALLTPYTPHIVEILQQVYPAKPKFNIHNCLNTSRFSYRAHPRLENPVLAWIGRIEDNKNWNEFLLISHHLLQHRPDLRLWMFEDPALSAPVERQQFYQMIQELELQHYLTIHADVPHAAMPDYFSRVGDSGGMLISTSKVEGGPMSVLEAISCRCPVLTTDSDGVRSAVVHNITGKYYTLGNIQEAVQEALTLMHDHTLRNNITEQALAHVQMYFSPEQYGTSFRSMLVQLGVY